MMEKKPSNKDSIGTVSFSVDGKWFTDFVRSRFIHEDTDFTDTVKLLKEMLAPNNLSDDRVQQIAIDIILGRSYFKGNTADGSFVFCDGSDEPIKPDFFKKFAAMKKALAEEKEAREAAVEAWQELALVVSGEMNRYDCECECNVELLRPTPAEEFIERMIADEEETAPYGFFSPDGEFHAVEWAAHEEFACDYMRNHGGFSRILEESPYDTAKDFLVLRLGWVLLHNPSQGKPILTRGDKRMTKAQRDALYSYFVKYGMKNEANALFEEE